MEKTRGGITPIWVVVLITIVCTFGCAVPQGTQPRIATIGGWCSMSVNAQGIGIEYDRERGTACQLEVGVRNVPENAQYGMPRHAWTNLTLGGKVLGAAPAEDTVWTGLHTQFEFLYVPNGVVEQHGPPEAQVREPEASPPSEVPQGPSSAPPLAATTWPSEAPEAAPQAPAETPTSPGMGKTPEPSEVPEPPAPSGE